MGNNEVHVLAPAKINLYLDVIGKRVDGYHELQMIMQSISLCDELKIESINPSDEEASSKNGQDLRLISNLQGEQLSLGQDNLIVQGVELLKKYYEIPPVKINLTKRIPVSAGLAGGSSDAAAVLWGVNNLFDLGISINELADLGSQIGSDVPFCLYGGTMLAEGRGEILTSLPSIPECYIVLHKPNFGVSTGEVYQALDAPLLDKDKIYRRTEINNIITSISRGNLDGILDYMRNDMEKIVVNWHKELVDIRTCFDRTGAQSILMSGSGPTMFGIYSDYSSAEVALAEFQKFSGQTELASPRSMGVGKE